MGLFNTTAVHLFIFPNKIPDVLNLKHVKAHKVFPSKYTSDLKKYFPGITATIVLYQALMLTN